MAFKDLGDWNEIGGLKLPIGGKVYALPPVSAELGPRLQALVATGIDIVRGIESADSDKEVLDDLAERDLYMSVLGPVYDEMTADGVPWAALKHAAMTSIMDAAIGREVAEKYWESAGKPPGRAPADRKPKKATTTRAKRSPARKDTASKTSTASTAGTTSRTPAKRAAKKPPTGRRSSNTGG